MLGTLKQYAIGPYANVWNSDALLMRPGSRDGLYTDGPQNGPSHAILSDGAFDNPMTVIMIKNQ